MRHFDRILSALLTVATLVIAGSVAKRTFFSVATADAESTAPDYVASWKNLEAAGIRIGSTSAPVTIVEFMDFECPACRTFHEFASAAMKKYPGKVALVYVPYPLPMHRFALPAARAAECAASQGRFEAWYNEIFSNQDSLGLKSWGAFAHAAGIGDTASIVKCALDPTPVARVTSGRNLGRQLGIPGTPTVLVNGWRFHRTPSAVELDRAIANVLSGKPVNNEEP